jgi:hypothetical protein
MKKICIVLFLSIIVSVYLNSQEQERHPWGVWNGDPVNLNDVYVWGSETTGRYYVARGSLNFIGIFSSWFSDYPVFAYDGSEDKVEKYEKTADGFLFYLIGVGYRRDPKTNKAEFQDNTRIKVKMTFIGQDECVFDFPDGLYYQNGRYKTGADKDDFILQNTPNTDTVYRRYPVKNNFRIAHTHITTESLRLREKATAASPTVAILNKGFIIQVLETGENATIDGVTAPWVKVATTDGTIGWCFSGYLKKL